MQIFPSYSSVSAKAAAAAADFLRGRGGARGMIKWTLVLMGASQ